MPAMPKTDQLLGSLSEGDQLSRQVIIERFQQIKMEKYSKDWEGKVWQRFVPGVTARPEQLPPAGEWRYWLLLAGRGSGKTRAAAEYMRMLVKQGYRSLAFVARTKDDIMKTMLKGDSGILKVCSAEDRDYKGRLMGIPKIKGAGSNDMRLEWANGAVAYFYSSEVPKALRGPNIDAFWADEFAAWEHINECWDNLNYTLRKKTRGEGGKILPTRGVLATTGRPIPLLKEISEWPETVVTRMKTHDNLENLDKHQLLFLERKLRKGGNQVREEIWGDILTELEGALFLRQWIHQNRMLPNAITPMNVDQHNLNIVVAVDPAVTAGTDSDETGIVVVGSDDKRGYILEDQSGIYQPHDWAQKVSRACRRWGVRAVVAEVNNGGDLVSETMRNVDKNLQIFKVRASKGKDVRAQPVSDLYQDNIISHVGDFPTLEDQMCAFVPGQRKKEDMLDRVDAMVWGFHWLLVRYGARNANAPLHGPLGTSKENRFSENVRRKEPPGFSTNEADGGHGPLVDRLPPDTPRGQGLPDRGDQVLLGPVSLS